MRNIWTEMICFPVYDVISFELNRSFLIKLLFCAESFFGWKEHFSIWLKRQKFKYLEKELLTWNKKHFSTFLMVFPYMVTTKITYFLITDLLLLLRTLFPICTDMFKCSQILKLPKACHKKTCEWDLIIVQKGSYL